MKAIQFLRDTVLELKDIDESALVPSLVLTDIDLDSLDYVEIQVGIKKNFSVSVDPELFLTGKIKTLGDLCQYIEDRCVNPTVTAASAQ